MNGESQTPQREEIWRAIRERRHLLLTYGNYSRIVEPHTLAEDPAGVETLTAYQVSGGDTSGVGSGWKTFVLSGIAAVRVLGPVGCTHARCGAGVAHADNSV